MVTTMLKQSNTERIRICNLWDKGLNDHSKDEKTCPEIFTMLISQEIEHVTIGEIQ
jgi:hypothetical protein